MLSLNSIKEPYSAWLGWSSFSCIVRVMSSFENLWSCCDIKKFLSPNIIGRHSSSWWSPSIFALLPESDACAHWRGLNAWGREERKTCQVCTELHPWYWSAEIEKSWWAGQIGMRRGICLQRTIVKRSICFDDKLYTATGLVRNVWRVHNNFLQFHY